MHNTEFIKYINIPDVSIYMKDHPTESFVCICRYMKRFLSYGQRIHHVFETPGTRTISSNT